VDPQERLRLLEYAVAELLESETNGSLRLGVRNSRREPLVVTAVGCSVFVAIAPRASVLLAMPSLLQHGSSGPRALAAGCDRTLRTVYRLPSGFVPSVSFDNPVNAAGWLGRMG
jgi:hypothetical protein